MKRFFLVLAALLLAPFLVSADVALGAAAFYQPPAPQPSAVSLDQMSVGATARLKLGLFQTEALLLYSAGNSVDVYLDAGLALDAAFLRLSLEAGQSFRNSLVGLEPQAGLNWKVGAEVLMGQISAGISYIMDLDRLPGSEAAGQPGLLGINLVFWL